MPSLRTEAEDRRYDEFRHTAAFARQCALCADPGLKAFAHWKILKNNFPYDRVAVVDHMIVPIRHVHEAGLTTEELDELAEIKRTYIDANYDYILETTDRKKSIPGHFHLHLIAI